MCKPSQLLIIIIYRSPSNATHCWTFSQAREDDLNHDGKYDRLDLNIEVPMLATDQVVGVKLLLFFYYRLRVRTICICVD